MRHSEFHPGVKEIVKGVHKETPLPVLQSQSDTRSSLQKVLRDVGDRLMYVAAGAFLISMAVLCAGNVGWEWLQQKLGVDPDHLD